MQARAPRANESRSGAGPTDAALVVAARANERWAQEALFRRYARMVDSLAYRLLGDADEARDLAQDAFYEVLTRLSALEQPAAFSTWLGTIVVRGAYKRIRKHRLLVRLGLRRKKEIDLDALPIARSAPPDVATELRRIYAALEDMPAQERVVIVLARVEGFSLSEIAAQLGVSLATVKRRSHAAHARIEKLRGDV
jgi:RNA polymerase sigma-70 factor, ECF subfamily